MLFSWSLVFMGQSQSSMPYFNWYVSIDSNRYVFVQKVTIFLMRWQLLAVFWYAERFTEPKCLASTLTAKIYNSFCAKKSQNLRAKKYGRFRGKNLNLIVALKMLRWFLFCFYLKVRIWISPPSSALNLMLVFEISSYYAVLI